MILGSGQLKRDDPELHKAYEDVQSRFRRLREAHAVSHVGCVPFLTNDELDAIVKTHPYVGWNEDIYKAVVDRVRIRWWGE